MPGWEAKSANRLVWVPRWRAAGNKQSAPCCSSSSAIRWLRPAWRSASLVRPALGSAPNSSSTRTAGSSPNLHRERVGAGTPHAGTKP
jgi:hypothetical protein